MLLSQRQVMVKCHGGRQMFEKSRSVQQYENVEFYKKITSAFYCKLHTFGNELSSTQDSLQQSS